MKKCSPSICLELVLCAWQPTMFCTTDPPSPVPGLESNLPGDVQKAEPTRSFIL